MHIYTEKTVFLSFFSPSFLYKSNLLEEQIGKKNRKNGPLSEDKQLFACRRTAVRLNSDSCPSGVRQLSDSSPTVVGLGKHYLLHLSPLLIDFLEPVWARRIMAFRQRQFPYPFKYQSDKSIYSIKNRVFPSKTD